MKKESTLNKFRFVNPIEISYMNKNGNDSRTQVLAERLEGVSPNQLVFVPCNVGYHWILTVIDPHKEVVYLLDSLSHRIRDGSWKNIVDMAINVFNATLGRKRKKHPSWEIIRCPIQPDSKQCGFYVMRFMKEIIEGLSKSGSNSIKSMFKKDPYSEDVEIDEVRKEWANCVLEYI